ncbi:wd domain-containing protein [Colletotrichum incanum]|uniref:Wd domain-containing protein n=1 Tax=Colletotrichum incanum TaxID=1573173 RepID=A0A167BRV9_COLIC|nr:wd domain-containing protein [Colletotrichum incanum]
MDGLGLLPGLNDIDYFGIGMGAELSASSSQTAENQSPGGLSIKLEPRGETRDFLVKDGAGLLHFRRSAALSPESVVASDQTKIRTVVPKEKDEQQAKQLDDDYPATPGAPSSSSLSTTPTFAGPLESYLACLQSHEKLALSLFRDDGDREQEAGSSDRDSIDISKRIVPGVYKPPHRSPSPLSAAPGSRSSRFGHLMERYPASEDLHELLGDQLGEIVSKSGHLDRTKAPGPEPEAAQPSEDAPSAPAQSIPLTTSPTAGSVALIAGVLDGPIEVGHDRHSQDSAISDMEADELHHLL